MSDNPGLPAMNLIDPDDPRHHTFFTMRAATWDVTIDNEEYGRIEWKEILGEMAYATVDVNGRRSTHPNFESAFSWLKHIFDRTKQGLEPPMVIDKEALDE